MPTAVGRRIGRPVSSSTAPVQVMSEDKGRQVSPLRLCMIEEMASRITPIENTSTRLAQFLLSVAILGEIGGAIGLRFGDGFAPATPTIAARNTIAPAFSSSPRTAPW